MGSSLQCLYLPSLVLRTSLDSSIPARAGVPRSGLCSSKAEVCFWSCRPWVPRFSQASGKAEDFFKSTRTTYGAQGRQCSLGLSDRIKGIYPTVGSVFLGVSRTTLTFAIAAETVVPVWGCCVGFQEFQHALGLCLQSVRLQLFVEWWFYVTLQYNKKDPCAWKFNIKLYHSM